MKLYLNQTVVTVGTFENGTPKTFNVTLEGKLSNARALNAAKRKLGTDALMLAKPSAEPTHIRKAYDVELDKGIELGVIREIEDATEDGEDAE